MQSECNSSYGRLIEIYEMSTQRGHQQSWRWLSHILNQERDGGKRRSMMGRLMMGIRVVLKVLSHTYNALNVHGGQAEAEEARIKHLSEAKHCVCMLMEAPHCDEPSRVSASRTT